MSPPAVLHVLPHPGGGGETYLRQLETIPGFHFERLPLTERGRAVEVPAGLRRLRRAIPRHDLVHVHGDSAALASLPLIGKRPTLITLHGSHLLRRASDPMGAAVRAGIRRAFVRADGVIAVSESELEFARGLAGKAVDRVELIRNGVPDPDPVSEEDRLGTRDRLGLGPESVAALFVGELSERKQPVQFAQAVRTARRESPELVGLLAGDGPLRRTLEPLQDDGLRLLGERDDIERLLAAADLFVLPSLWEGLPYALLEAMAAGRATLVSDGPGNPDAVGETGLVFPTGDVASMATSLSRLAGDSELRGSLGRAALERVRERFTLSGMTEATARAYERALNRGADR